MTIPTLSIDGGRVRLDLATRQLFVAGEPARLGGRAFDVLVALVDRRDRVVSKQELLDLVWPGLFVEENNLQVHVMSVRKLLGPQAIATVSGRGYRFTLDVRPVDGPTPTAALHEAPVAVAVDRTDGLIGREALIAQVDALLVQSAHRLLTLTGPGGSGKTRLALRATASWTARRSDPAFVVSLAPLRDAGLLTATVATALGLEPHPAQTPAQQVRTYLQARRVLLLLDNLEHLPDVAAPIAGLLADCPMLQIIATSRLLLRVAGEVEVKVPPLDLPVGDSTAEIVAAPAVRLLVRRAAEAGHALPDTAQDWQAAAQVCRRLDGLPLAIELAAARLRTLTVSALAARLAHSLALLKGGAADSPARQQTLRATIAWSHDLLDASARRLFRRVGVFAGGWSLDAAEALDDDPAGTVDRLETLLDHHLIQRLDDLGGQPRYAMLETLREFAIECLEAAQEGVPVRRRHAEWMADLARREERLVLGVQRPAALLRLQAERHNLRAALDFARQDERGPALLVRLVAYLGWWWYFDDALREGESWVDPLLPGLGADTAPGLAARCWTNAARLAFYSGSIALAHERAARAAELAQRDGGAEVLAQALLIQALAANPTSTATANAVMERSHAQFMATGEPWDMALGTFYRGVLLYFLPGGDDQSAQFLNEARVRFEALGDPWGCSGPMIYLGLLAERRGDFDAGYRQAHAVVVAATAAGDRFREAAGLHLVARSAFRRGNVAEAAAHVSASIALSLRRGHEIDALLGARWLAFLCWRQGRHDTAARLFGAAPAVTGNSPLRLILGPRHEADCSEAQRAVEQELAVERWQMLTSEGRARGLERLLQEIAPSTATLA